MKEGKIVSTFPVDVAIKQDNLYIKALQTGSNIMGIQNVTHYYYHYYYYSLTDLGFLRISCFLFWSDDVSLYIGIE